MSPRPIPMPEGCLRTALPMRYQTCEIDSKQQYLAPSFRPPASSTETEQIVWLAL